MKRKNLLLSFICSMALMLSWGGLAACSDDPDESAPSASVETSEGTSEETSATVIANVPEKFNLKLSAIDDETKAADYYLNGVTANKDGENVAVSVDLSKVDFTKAGAYEITYSADGEDATATSTVCIYDTPVIVAEGEISLGWFMATEESALIEKIAGSVSAKDSLDGSLSVSVVGEFAKNDYGFYAEGTYSVTLTAEDIVGNVATKEVTLTMTRGVAPTIENLTVDLSNIAVALTDYEIFVDFDLYAVGADGLTKLTNKEVKYDVSIGGTVFTEEYAASLAGAGETQFIFVLSNAYGTVSATVTDENAPAFSYSDATSFAYVTGEEFALPQATKNMGSAQAIDVKYTLDGAEYTENPTKAGEYTYAIEFYRGSDKVLTKEYKIVLVENYGWSGATVKATEKGNIALTGKEGDVNPVLSAEYIAAQGKYNTIVVKAKVLQESSNQADTDEATGPSFWWIDGNTYVLTGVEQYYGVSKDKVATGAELTFTLRVEASGSATFILRNFDGWLEITEMEFLYLDAKLAAQQKLNTNFPGWDYVHHGDANAYVDGKTYHLKGNFTLTNLLVSDAMAAGYKYVTMRVKMTHATTPIEEIYFVTKESGYAWDYYWNSFSGNEIVVRLDLSKYFESADLTNSGNNVVQFFGRYVGGNDISAEAIEVELIGFETAETADHFVSVPTGGNYTVTGATYAKAVDGSATFAIAAKENHAIDSVTAKDATVTDNGDGTYTVSGITKDTYLAVATRKTAHTVTLAESQSYTADKYSVTVKEGEACTFTITANEGFEIESVSADNGTLTDNGDGTYTLSGVTAATTVTVSAKAAKSSYIITLTAGESYTASFARTEVEKNSEYSFTVTANEGYQISSVVADNATVRKNGNGSYTLTNILNDTVVTVTTVKQVNLAEKILSSEGNFWNYFHFGAWGTNTWDGKSVNVTTSNFQIQKAFLDDALTQGYTHAKISVSAASSDIASVVLLTDGSLGWNYYWKLYNGNSADVRIDLNAYKGKDYSTLTIEFRNSAGAGTDSSVTLTGIEFYKSEETTQWMKTSNCMYAAYEGDKLVVDMLGAGGNPTGISTTTEWWKKYAGVCANSAIRLYAEYLYVGNNSRAPLWGKNGVAVDVMHGNGTGAGWRWLNDQNYAEGDTFFFTADAESVFTVELVEWVSNRNEWSGTTLTEVDADTVKVTGLEGQYLWLATYADYVAAGYKTVTINATYTGGQLWVGNDVWGDSGYMHAVNGGEAKTLELSKMEKFCLHFSAATTGEAEITVTFNK